MEWPFHLGMWTLGAPEPVRLREREAMFIPVRWLFVVSASLAVMADTGEHPFLAWATPAVVVAINVVASTVPGRIESARGLRLFGLGVNVADGAVVVASMFNYAATPDTATGLILMLIVFEAALRFGLPGGLIAGVLAGTASQVWMLFRESEHAIPYAFSTAGARTGAYVLGGMLLGMLVSQLEVAGHQVRAHLRRTDAVGRFAIDAPRLGVDEAALRLAAILHEDLGHEFAAVVVVDDNDPQSFRTVATAGYEKDLVARYERFPVSEGIVGRCFRTGEAQLLPDVTLDPDYMVVDPRTRSEMTVPLRARGEVFGALDVASPLRGAFDEEDLHFLETVGAQLALAFDNARLAAIERRTITELEELAVMKDDFIAIANHELRTPVTTISGFAQSLLKQRHMLTPEEMDDAIERIARQSAHLKRLIEDLLTVPGAPGRGALSSEAVSVLEVAEEVVRELDPRDGLHELRIEAAPELPPVDADRSAVRRVLVNLIGNALKYSPHGGPVTVAGGAGDHAVRVTVTDEGIGIDPEDVPVLFTKFGKAGTSESGGMGLGLFIVKELVEGMGGTVGVDTAPGRGSDFWFELPLSSARARAEVS